MPLAGALTPASGGQMPLVLPAGPTDSDPARAPADIVAGTRRGRLHRRRHEHRQGQGRAAAARRRDDHRARGRAASAAGAAGARALRRRRRARGRARRSTTASSSRSPCIPGEQGAVAAGTLLTGGAVTVTFGTAEPDEQPRDRLDRGVLVHRPRLRRLGQARPRRARRRHHELGAGRRLQRRTAARRSRPRRSRAPRRSCGRRIPTWSPRVVRGALVGTARAVRDEEGDGAAPVEAQGGGSRQRGRRERGDGRRRARLALVRARARTAASASSACSRSRTRARRPSASRCRSLARRRATTAPA